MSEHTPGPWYLVSDGGRCLVSRAWADPDRWLAEVRTNVPQQTGPNARLIAAAPDLLEALVGVIERYKFSMLLHGQTDSGFESSGEIVKARAAIRKAKGES